MDGRIVAGFVAWVCVGLAAVVYGLYGCFSKRKTAIGFWANAKTFPMEDVGAYNRAVGVLWCIFGAVFSVLGFPLLAGQNSPWVFVSIIGGMAEAIVLMAVYTVVIEGKYRRK